MSRHNAKPKPENCPGLPQLMLEPMARIRVHKHTETDMGSASAKTVTNNLPILSVLAVAFFIQKHMDYDILRSNICLYLDRESLRTLIFRYL